MIVSPGIIWWAEEYLDFVHFSAIEWSAFKRQNAIKTYRAPKKVIVHIQGQIFTQEAEMVPELLFTHKKNENETLL